MAMTNGAFTRTNGAEGGATVYPRFFMDTVQDLLASEREGRPIFRDEERVEILMSGNTFSKPVFRVTQEHRDRWPTEYAGFLKGIEISPEGTPLEEWPRLRRSQVLELKALNFVTVEQVAEMSDHAIQRIPMYGRQLRELAKAFIDDAHAVALLEQTTADNTRKDAEISGLRLQVENLGKQMQEMFGEMRRTQDAPNAIASHIPGMSDPVSLARGPAEPPGASSFAGLDTTRRRPGRPRKVAEPETVV